MSVLSDYNAAVDRILQDTDAVLTSGNIDSIIQSEATQMYSKNKPFKDVVDISANGDYDYAINATNFPYWSDGFSEILKVEYPAGEYQVPNEIPFEEWTIYETASAKYLRFLDISPTSGYTIRVLYTGPHSITTQTSTVYSNDFGAFCILAASFCGAAIANRYAELKDSTIGADAVAYRDKSDIWASRAKDLLKRYMDFMFPEISAASAMKEFDLAYNELGLSRLTHPDWTR